MICSTVAHGTCTKTSPYSVGRQCSIEGRVELSGGDIHTEEGRLIEAFSFYHARLVICASEDERLLARWANGAARRTPADSRQSKSCQHCAHHISVLEQSQQVNPINGMVATDIQSLRQSQDGLEWKFVSDFMKSSTDY